MVGSGAELVDSESPHPLTKSLGKEFAKGHISMGGQPVT